MVDHINTQTQTQLPNNIFLGLILIMSAPEKQPWHAAHPTPTSTAVFLPQATVLEWIESSEKITGRDFVLVDLRRNDHEVGLFTYLYEE